MSRSARYLIILITAGFLLATLVKTFYLSYKYGGTDLRCRIVGTRLMGTGESPYFYQWKPGDNVFYLDPNAEAHRLVNGNVVTPASMAVIYPLAQLSYPLVRLWWTILQVVAALLILHMLFRRNKLSDAFLAASPIILGLICSEHWFFNIERGQMYVFYAFVLTSMYAVYISRWKHNEFASGFIGGLFILFRPFAGIIGLGFLLHGKMKWVAGCATGFIVGCLLFVLPFLPAWKDYFRAMDEYVSENVEAGHHDFTAIAPSKPAVIEGADNLTASYTFFLDRLDTTYHLLKGVGISISNNQSLLLYGIIMLVTGFFFYRLRKKISSPQNLFLFGFLALILAELFVLAPRGAYNIIQWIFPLSLIWLQASKKQSGSEVLRSAPALFPALPVLIILATGLLLLHNFPYKLPRQGQLAELIFIGLSFYWIFFKQEHKAHKEPQWSQSD